VLLVSKRDHEARGPTASLEEPKPEGRKDEGREKKKQTADWVKTLKKKRRKEYAYRNGRNLKLSLTKAKEWLGTGLKARAQPSGLLGTKKRDTPICPITTKKKKDEDPGRSGSGGKGLKKPRLAHRGGKNCLLTSEGNRRPPYLTKERAVSIPALCQENGFRNALGKGDQGLLHRIAGGTEKRRG